jgi:predicted nucleic acid-binding protein
VSGKDFRATRPTALDPAAPMSSLHRGPEALAEKGKTRLVVVADTGPLLCAGIIGRQAINMLYQQLNGRILAPRAVIHELEYRVGQTGRYVSSDQKVLRNAAQRLTGTRGTFIRRDMTTYDNQKIQSLRAEINAAEAARALNTGHDHSGEIEAILLATAQTAIVMTNDGDATTVARNHGLVVVNFATVLAVEVREGRLTGVDASKLCDQIKPHTHPGTHHTEPLDFGRLRVPDGF